MAESFFVFSKRWILAYLFSTGFFVMYAMRVNISLAIICMVKKPENNESLELMQRNNTDHENQCEQLNIEAQKSYQSAEFNWNQNIISSILTAYFYGYIITQIPGGWLADRFGGRLVLGVAMTIAGLCNILMPVCARSSYIFVYVLRFIIGFASGVTLPVCQSMWGRWAPILERSKLVALSYTGGFVGIIVTYASSGVLCAHGFDNGWASIFYITGVLCCMWVVIWFIQAWNSPADHPGISEVERDYIFKNIEVNTKITTCSLPWKQFLKSRCLWAIIVAHFCNNWGEYTLVTLLPEFLNSVLKFDITSNGLLSAAPFLCMAIMSFVAGMLADYLRSKHLLTTTQTRKVFQIFAFIGAGIFLVATGFVPCTKRELAVVFLCVAVSTVSFMQGGYVVNHLDISPIHAGTLLGITNTIATLPGIISPILAGYLTPNGTQNEWKTVFYVAASFYIFGAIFYGIFASGEIQPWSKDINVDVKQENRTSTSIVYTVNS